MLGLAGTCCGQKAANFRAYKLGDGLPESACISVTVSAMTFEYEGSIFEHLSMYQIKSGQEIVGLIGGDQCPDAAAEAGAERRGGGRAELACGGRQVNRFGNLVSQ